jgi:hypothetical protein
MSQFLENWSTNTIRPTLWSTTLAGLGGASAATGKLVLTLSGGGQATVANPGSSTNRYDLTAADALADGIVVDVFSLSSTGARFYFGIVDSTGKGWTAHYDFAADSIYLDAVNAGSGSLESRLGTTHGGVAGYSGLSARYWRFMKVGTDVQAYYSPDRVTWTVMGSAAPITTETVTAVGVVLEVISGSSTISATVGEVNVGNTPAITATHPGLVIEARNGKVRQSNTIAAVGKTLDYRIKLAAYDAGGAVDTGYTGLVTATVEVGACTLGGTVARNCVAGVVDFADLYPATGTGLLAIRFSASGLTPYITPSMTVVNPAYDTYALVRHGVLVEQPRIEIDTTLPTLFTRTITVGPAKPVVAGVSYNTLQAAFNYCAANDIAGNTKILADLGTYNATTTHKARAAGNGRIVIQPSLIALPVGVRPTKANLATYTPFMPKVSVENPGGMLQCEAGAYGYTWVGFNFEVPVPALGTVTEIFAGVTVWIDSPPSLADYPHHIGFERCAFHSTDPVNTRLRKTILLDCPHLYLESCYVDDAHDYPNGVNNGNGNGDTNALGAGSYSPGPFLANNTYFSGAGEVVLFGGADPDFYDAKTRDIIFTRCLFFKDPAWMGVYPAKNTFELKSCGRILLEGCIFDGSWEAGQDGSGFVAGSANQGGTPATDFEGIRDLTMRNCFCRNMTIWAVLSGINYINAEIMHGVSVYNVVGANMHPVGYGEDSNHLLATGNGIYEFVMEQCTILAPEARSVRFMNFYGYPAKASPQSYIRRNIVTCGSIGINVDAFPATPVVALATEMPDDDLRENVFIAKAGSNGEDGVGMPPLSFYPKLYSQVGFVDYPGAEAIWAAGNPDTICTKLALAATSPYKESTSDETDPGANMAQVRAAIAGVWTGTAGSGGVIPDEDEDVSGPNQRRRHARRQGRGR